MNCRNVALVGMLCAMPVLGLAQPVDEFIQTDRYTQVSLSPSAEQKDPLKAVVKTHFPAGSIETVGEALDYLLARSGYQLAHPNHRDPKVQALFSLPLPSVHRDIGPVRLDTALSMLAGSGYAVVFDRVNRLVSIDLRPQPSPH